MPYLKIIAMEAINIIISITIIMERRINPKKKIIILTKVINLKLQKIEYSF